MYLPLSPSFLLDSFKSDFEGVNIYHIEHDKWHDFFLIIGCSLEKIDQGLISQINLDITDLKGRMRITGFPTDDFESCKHSPLCSELQLNWLYALGKEA